MVSLMNMVAAMVPCGIPEIILVHTDIPLFPGDLGTRLLLIGIHSKQPAAVDLSERLQSTLVNLAL